MPSQVTPTFRLPWLLSSPVPTKPLPSDHRPKVSTSTELQSSSNHALWKTSLPLVQLLLHPFTGFSHASEGGNAKVSAPAHSSTVSLASFKLQLNGLPCASLPPRNFTSRSKVTATPLLLGTWPLNQGNHPSTRRMQVITPTPTSDFCWPWSQPPRKTWVDA